MDNNKQTNLDSIKNLERNTELRQKELHLKKWEEELKLKGKLINENDKDRTKLLSYVTKLENRNHMSYFYIFRLYKLELSKSNFIQPILIIRLMNKRHNSTIIRKRTLIVHLIMDLK